MAIPKAELNFDNAVYYHSGKFPPKHLDYAKVYKILANATAALARYDQMLRNMHNSEILLAPLRNQEAVISSRMEGTISTMDEILEYEAELADGNQKPGAFRSEVLETLLYQRALKTAQKALDEGKPFSEWLVRSLHERLLEFGRGAAKSPGSYKEEQNYLVDKTKRNVLFVPISPVELASGLELLFSYISSDEQSLIRTGISHVEFEALHPFQDGNGRVGRMLITLMLWQEKQISAPHFYISGYLEENKDEYIDYMRKVSQCDDWSSWCVFFLNAIESQAQKNLEVATAIRDLYEDMKPKFAEVLASKWSTQALDFVFANPVFRNNTFVHKSGIPTATARRFTKVLYDKSFLQQISEASGQKAALYRFEPLMKLVRV